MWADLDLDQENSIQDLVQIVEQGLACGLGLDLGLVLDLYPISQQVTNELR